MNLIVLLNHDLSQNQKEGARFELGVSNIKYMSNENRELWSKIDPTLLTLSDLIEPLLFELQMISKEKDYVLVQGDFGATYMVVSFCKLNGLIPIYSTTKRISEDILLKNGRVKTRKIFRHVMYRVYGF